MRSVRPGLGAVAVAVVVGLLAVSVPGSAGQEAQPQEDPAPEVPELPPAPPGLTAELSTMYATAYRIVQHASELGATDPEGDPVELPDDPATFHDDLAALDQPQLDLAYAAISEVPDWAEVQPALDALDDLTGQTAELQELMVAQAPSEPVASPDPAAAADAGGSYGTPDPGIAPPLDPFQPSSPPTVLELPRCPPRPAGPDFGNFAIHQAALAAIAVKAVFKLIPKFFFAASASIQNPVASVFAVLTGIVDLVDVILGYLKDRYAYCEGENQYLLTFNAENTALAVWELMRRTEGTLADVNGGVIIVSDQIKAAQGASDEILAADLHQALAAPLDVAPNVAYQLPAADGGYLDSTPIGVQAIVTSSLEAAQRAGLPVGPAASALLAQADDALGQHRYADAYHLYQRCYQELGR